MRVEAEHRAVIDPRLDLAAADRCRSFEAPLAAPDRGHAELVDPDRDDDIAPGEWISRGRTGLARELLRLRHLESADQDGHAEPMAQRPAEREVIGLGKPPLAVLDPRQQPRDGVSARLQIPDLGHLVRVDAVRLAELRGAVHHQVEQVLIGPAGERLEARDVEFAARGGDVRRRAFDQRVVVHAPDYRRPSSSTTSDEWKRAITRRT
jgi:hypothetical protein